MRILIAAAAALLAGTSAQAQSPAAPAVPAQTLKCPVGGAAFEYRAGTAGTSIGERPDGRPYSNVAVPMPLPECPDNHLVLYKDYEPEEVAKLEPLISSDAYKALIAADTQYYRAYWLMKEMGVAPERYLVALLQAGWEAESKPELRARYLAELAEKSAAVPARPDDINWIGMEARAVNALRELGRFDEAKARLAKIPTLGLDIDVGEEAEPEAGKKTDPKQRWLAYLNKQRAAIARKDSGAEPFDMIPRALALSRCLAAGTKAKLAKEQKAFCDKESAAVEELRVKRAGSGDLKALARPREESGR